MGKEHGLLRVHPSFRIVATALPPTPSNRWLTSDLLPLFLWHEMPKHSQKDLGCILAAAAPPLAPPATDTLLRLAAALEHMSDTGAGGGAPSSAAATLSAAAPSDAGGAISSAHAPPPPSVEASNHPGGLTLSPRQLLRIATRAAVSK